MMRPGFYLSESGTLQKWMPKVSNHQIMYTVKDGAWIKVKYTNAQLKLITSILDFKYLGPLK